MVELLAETPLEKLLPIEVDGCRLSAVSLASITSVAPFQGQESKLSALMKAAHGFGFPTPQKSTAKAIWTGQGQAMLLGVAADKSLAKYAALTDQTDGWVVVTLEGGLSRAVLARLTPLDLRAGVFKRGHTARSELGHMMVSVTRVGAQAFQIMGFRSMAKTLVHELQGAMKSLAAQG